VSPGSNIFRVRRPMAQATLPALKSSSAAPISKVHAGKDEQCRKRIFIP
jgi:hypothetical protein